MSSLSYPLTEPSLQLSDEKLNDLRSLLSLKPVKPDDKKAFYEGIQAGGVEHDISSSDEEGDMLLDYCN